MKAFDCCDEAWEALATAAKLYKQNPQCADSKTVRQTADRSRRAIGSNQQGKI